MPSKTQVSEVSAHTAPSFSSTKKKTYFRNYEKIDEGLPVNLNTSGSSSLDANARRLHNYAIGGIGGFRIAGDDSRNVNLFAGSSTNFEDIGRFTAIVDGGGAVTFGIDGAQFNSSATDNSAASLLWGPTMQTNVFAGNPFFSAQLYVGSSPSIGLMYAGLGDVQDATPRTTAEITAVHAGFKITNGTLYATVADGTTETVTELCAVAINDVLEVALKFIDTTQVIFFYRQNVASGGRWTSGVTIATNLPSKTTASDNYYWVTFQTDNLSTTNDVVMIVGTAAYER